MRNGVDETLCAQRCVLLFCVWCLVFGVGCGVGPGVHVWCGVWCTCVHVVWCVGCVVCARGAGHLAHSLHRAVYHVSPRLLRGLWVEKVEAAALFVYHGMYVPALEALRVLVHTTSLS